MNFRLLTFFSVASIVGIVYWMSYNNLLGPYGLPNDNLHLLLLASVLFIAFMAWFFVSHGGRRR